jgi:hypothetical protein
MSGNFPSDEVGKSYTYPVGTGKRTIEAFFEKFLFARGEEMPKVRVRVAYTVTLDETGNEYAGEARGIFMTMDREVVNTVPTRVKATRLSWSI